MLRPLAVAVLFAATVVTAAPSEGPRAGETIDVSIVNVDAIVTDRTGNRVHGLTQDDFEILENGKPRPISNFADVSQPRDAAHPQPRTIVVFVEHFRTADFRRDAFFNGLRAFLHKGVRSGDAVKIVSFGDRLETRLDFTDKLAAIDRTLDAMAAESGPGIDDITLKDRLIAETFNSISAERNQTVKHRNTSDPLNPERNFRYMKTREMVESITALMSSIAGSDAKKVFVMALQRFEPADFRDRLADRVARTANANGVTVYPLFPEGIAATSFSSADQELFNRQAPFLQEIADATGGRFAWGTEIEHDLPKAAADLDAYYSLGYRATNHNIDKARTILVRTKNRDYTVRARREYVEKSDQTRMHERVIAALFNQPEVSSMNIVVEAAKPRYVTSTHCTIPVTVYIPLSSLMTDGGRGEFAVYVGWSGIGGEIGGVTRQTQKFSMTMGMPEMITYSFDVVADRDTGRLSVGVFDEVSKDYGLRRIELAKSDKVARR